MPVSKKLLVVCNDEWKEFLGQPSLKYILRLLTGESMFNNWSGLCYQYSF